MTSYGQMSDSEQCLNRLERDLMSPLVNFVLCELGQIITRYDFLWTRRVILIGHPATFYVKLDDQIMTRYDFLLHRQMILSNVRTDSQLNLILLINFSCELG